MKYKSDQKASVNIFVENEKKSDILFHKNGSPRDFYIMTVYNKKSHHLPLLLYWTCFDVRHPPLLIPFKMRNSNSN